MYGANGVVGTLTIRSLILKLSILSKMVQVLGRFLMSRINIQQLELRMSYKPQKVIHFNLYYL